MWDALLGMASHVCHHLDPRRRLLVVALHRIGGTRLSTETVRRQLAFVAKHYEVVHPSQMAACGRRRRVAMVTVDDGHADVYSEFFPIASSLGLPFGLCPSTDFLLRRRWLWFDKFDWAIGQAAPGGECSIGSRQIRLADRASIAAFRQWLKEQPPGLRDEILARVFHGLRVEVPPEPLEEYRPVNQQELKEMLSSGLLELVGHTVTHTALPVLANAERTQELMQSKRELEELAGKEVLAFCYPNGDFDERSDAAVRQAGFQMAFTTLEGMNWQATMNPFQLKRMHVHLRDAVFLKQASGLGDLQRLVGLQRSND